MSLSRYVGCVHGLVLVTRNVSHVESLDIEWVDPFDASG
jgi:hypothetical protein